MLNNLKNKNLVVLNTPANFDLSIFDNFKNTENYHKVIFLIHQIDYYTHSEGVFKIHKESYYQFLGINNHQLNKLLGLLINEAKLIEHIYTGNSFTGRLSEYKFLDPFNPETGVKHQYDVEDDKCPEFIKKWVADGFRVLPTEKSAYKRIKKEVKKPKVKTTTDSILVQQLIEENEKLKIEIASLRQPLVSPEAIVRDEEISIEVISPISELPVIEADEKLIQHSFGEILIQNYNDFKVATATLTDDDVQTLVDCFAVSAMGHKSITLNNVIYNFFVKFKQIEGNDEELKIIKFKEKIIRKIAA